MAGKSGSADLEKTFEALCGVLRRRARKESGRFMLWDSWPGSKAKEKKKTLILMGKKEVSVFHKQPEKMYVAGVMMQKGYVGFYFMPIYCKPKEFVLSARLKKLLKGKSCFYVKEVDEELMGELDALMGQGVACFRKLGWV